ncbi:MAG: type IV secretion system protein [Alphaproteobacteria bacterium]
MRKTLKSHLRLWTACIGITVFLSPLPSKAQGIPVIDTSSIAQTILQLEQMATDYQNQIQQLDQALATYNSITGGRNLGDLQNSSAEQDLRRALPPGLQDLIGLNNASGLGASGLQTQGIYNDILSTYQPITGANLIPSDPTGSLASAHDRQSNTTYAAMAASESAYNTASQRLQGYETMLQELNNTQDLKASVDLLARITAENGILLNELMRMQSLQMQLNAANSGKKITDVRRTAESYDYDPSIAIKSFESEE